MPDILIAERKRPDGTLDKISYAINSNDTAQMQEVYRLEREGYHCTIMQAAKEVNLK